MTRPRIKLGIVGMARLECYLYGKSPVITCTFCAVKNSISLYVFMGRYFVERSRTLIPGHRLSYEKLHARFVYKMTLTLCVPPPTLRLLCCTSSPYLRSMPVIVVRAFRHSSRPICKRTIAIIIKANYVGGKQRFSLVWPCHMTIILGLLFSGQAFELRSI